MKTEKSRRIPIRRRRALIGLAFFSPWIVGFLLFTFYPVLYALMLSVNAVTIPPDGNIITEFRGLEYFKFALQEDTVFPIDLGQAILFIACATPIIVVFALIIGLFLNQKFRGRTFFRAVFFLPVIIMSGPVFSELLTGQGAMVLEPSQNAVYKFLQTMPENMVKPVLYALDNLVMILWFSGVQIILFLAGLQKIDSSLYEAASIDGATAWEKFWKITLPYLRPLIMVNAIYTVVEVSNFSGLAVNDRIQQMIFQTGRTYSFSAAMAWIYFIVVLGLLLLVFLLTNDWKGRRKEGLA